LRRALNLPHYAHSYTLPLLSDTLPVYTDICKHSARFICSCLFRANSRARFIARHSVYVTGHHSRVDGKISLCCKFFCWSLSDCLQGRVDTGNGFFHNFSKSNLTGDQLLTADFLSEVIRLHEGCYFLSGIGLIFRHLSLVI
jgi:hypothetical protein